MTKTLGNHDVRVEVARSLSDMMKITALRAAVYMAEQTCPYD